MLHSSRRCSLDSPRDSREPKQRTSGGSWTWGCLGGRPARRSGGAGDGVWHFDRAWHAIVKTPISTQPVVWDDKATAAYRTPEPMDWGEKPFGSSTKGVAHDGKNLWVLDGENARVCIVEKAESG